MEAVVLYGGQDAEEKSAVTNFEILYWRMRSLFKRAFYLMFFVVLQANIVNPVSYLVVALTVIRTGTINGQPVTRSSAQEAGSGLASFITSLSSIPATYSTVGTIAGITHRVGQLLEALEELEVRSRVCAAACLDYCSVPLVVPVTCEALQVPAVDGHVLAHHRQRRSVSRRSVPSRRALEWVSRVCAVVRRTVTRCSRT